MIVLVGIMLVMLLGMAAFSVDIGYLGTTKATLRAAADAGALAAAGGLAENNSLSNVESMAVNYANMNVPSNYGTIVEPADVSFGVWDPEYQTFTVTSTEPNAVRIVANRTQSRSNAVPYFLARVFGMQNEDLVVEAIATGASSTSSAAYDNSVYVTSSKDLSNVVLEFADGTHQKFEDIQGYALTFQGTGEYEGEEIVGIWIKSGCNPSGEGPGYGERVVNPWDGSTAHGENWDHGCTPHVTATFEATGVQYTESGSISPVRLVQ